MSHATPHPRGLQVFFLGVILVLGACDTSKDSAVAAAGDTAPAATATNTNAEEDLADVSNYRLTMDKYDKYITAQRNLMLKVKDMPPAKREAFESRQSNDQNASLDDMVKKIESEPIAKDAVRVAGLSPREYVMITMSMMQTAMAAGIAKMRPNDNQDSLIREMKANPENVKFFTENEAELTRKQNAFEAEMQRLGATDDQ